MQIQDFNITAYKAKFAELQLVQWEWIIYESTGKFHFGRLNGKKKWTKNLLPFMAWGVRTLYQ